MIKRHLSHINSPIRMVIQLNAPNASPTRPPLDGNYRCLGRCFGPFSEYRLRSGIAMLVISQSFVIDKRKHCEAASIAKGSHRHRCLTVRRCTLVQVTHVSRFCFGTCQRHPLTRRLAGEGQLGRIGFPKLGGKKWSRRLNRKRPLFFLLRLPFLVLV